MAVTINKPVNTGGNTWLLVWSSGLEDPVFHVYRDGLFLYSTSRTSGVFVARPSDTLVIEVRDDAAIAETAAETAVDFSWQAVSGADKYRVEEYVDAAWVPRVIIADEGLESHRYRTARLGDGTTQQFRVTPIATDGNEGTPSTFNVAIARIPDPPAVTFTYDDETNKVTVEAA